MGDQRALGCRSAVLARGQLFHAASYNSHYALHK